MRWSWPALLAGLVVVAVLLAWADSTVLRPLFPEPFAAPRRPDIRPALPPFGRRQAAELSGFGPVGGLYSFWWFVSVGGALVLVMLAALVAVPGRCRRAAQRIGRGTLPPMAAAGVATVLLGIALTVLLRVGFLLLSIVPFLWALAALAVVFGTAVLALASGRWLRARLGPAPPLLAALAALLVLLDVGLVPVAGWIVLAVVALTALGLSVLTRMGSPAGWSLEDLNW
jgi:hypothetical protein